MHTSTMPNYLFSIDTLQFSKRLHKAGLAIEVAEEIAETIKDSQTQSFDSLVTKQELKSLEQKLEQKFIAIDQKFETFDQKFEMFDQKFRMFDQKFETLEYKLTVKMFVAMIAAVSIVTWLDKVIG